MGMVWSVHQCLSLCAPHAALKYCERTTVIPQLPLRTGKTRTINHFLMNDSWYLVDLPGYGYARTSKQTAQVWNDFTRSYFLERETLVAVLLLVDASIPTRDVDVQAAAWFEEAQVGGWWWCVRASGGPFGRWPYLCASSKHAPRSCSSA